MPCDAVIHIPIFQHTLHQLYCFKIMFLRPGILFTPLSICYFIFIVFHTGPLLPSVYDTVFEDQDWKLPNDG